MDLGITPLDFPGIVRAFAHFYDIDPDALELDFDINDDCYAKVYGKHGNLFKVQGNFTALGIQSQMGILNTAVHEVGHIALGHVPRKRFWLLKTALIFGRSERKIEKEACAFAEIYTVERTWRQYFNPKKWGWV